MINRSGPIVVPSVLLAEHVNDVNGAVGSKLLAKEINPAVGKRVEKEAVQSSSGIEGDALAGMERGDPASVGGSQSSVVLVLHKKSVFAERSQSGVDIDRADLCRA